MTPQRRGELEDCFDLLLRLDLPAMRETLRIVLAELGVWQAQIPSMAKIVEDVCFSGGSVHPGASISFLGVCNTMYNPPVVLLNCANILHKPPTVVWEFIPNAWVGSWECHVWIAVIEMAQPAPQLEPAGATSWLVAGVCN